MGRGNQSPFQLAVSQTLSDNDGGDVAVDDDDGDDEEKIHTNETIPLVKPRFAIDIHIESVKQLAITHTHTHAHTSARSPIKRVETSPFRFDFNSIGIDSGFSDRCGSRHVSRLKVFRKRTTAYQMQ